MVPFFSHGSNFLASPFGGDVEKISHFQSRKIRLHCTIFCTTSNENLNTRVDMFHITKLFIGKSKNAWGKSSKNLLNRIDNMEQVFQGGARFLHGGDVDENADFQKFVWG